MIEMTKIFTAFVLLVIFSVESIAQKKPEIVYNPIPGANIEEAFPVAAALLYGTYKIGVEQIDWGKGTMKSTYIEYFKLLSKVRSKYQVIIDANSTLNVEIVDVEFYDLAKKEWIPESYGKVEKKMKAGFIFDINVSLQKPDVVKKSQDWFYKELYINALFFENATELAGNRWFDNYLRDRKVSWKVVFHDIKKNIGGQYKFMEEYSRVLSTMTTVQTNFLLTKYTNSDKNTMASKNLPIVLEGYCRSLSYSDGVFNISLTDEVDSAMPNNSFQQEQTKEQKSVLDFAEKLKQLKSLLDQGIITKEEYETEKKKILAGKQ